MNIYLLWASNPVRLNESPDTKPERRANRPPGKQKGVIEMLTKAIATTLIAAVAIVALPQAPAYAGDKEWATAGKILAGVVGAAIIHEVATSDRNRRADQTYVRYQGRQYEGRRVRYVRSPRRVWIAGYYVARQERVWVDGYWEKIWVAPEYRQIKVIRYDRRGRPSTHWERVLVCEGHYEKVWREGYWETREVREWVPGHWEYR